MNDLRPMNGNHYVHLARAPAACAQAVVRRNAVDIVGAGREHLPHQRFERRTVVDEFGASTRLTAAAIRLPGPGDPDAVLVVEWFTERK